MGRVACLDGLGNEHRRKYSFTINAPKQRNALTAAAMHRLAVPRVAPYRKMVGRRTHMEVLNEVKG